MEDTRQCCNPFPCPCIGGDKTCEECNCYRDDYWDEDERQIESEGYGGIIEQLENAIELIKQDGKDWLDDRDIPILEVCIKSLTALDKIKAEITAISINGQVDEHTMFIRTGEQVKQMVLNIIDKYMAEGREE